MTLHLGAVAVNAANWDQSTKRKVDRPAGLATGSGRMCSLGLSVGQFGGPTTVNERTAALVAVYTLHDGCRCCRWLSPPVRVASGPLFDELSARSGRPAPPSAAAPRWDGSRNSPTQSRPVTGSHRRRSETAFT